ncbi:Prokaryotic membrane lipoprotein lipid attachment site profile (plasmid) [Nostoc flagelliforme CCNUN1]|uniref:Prokaryotic membrane lipoprotein lipid attachment site profile n=2 Tax=Nostoc flagelliforme TaxID=1306274 RepID=A0A2K8T8N4_9NOSO|nr:Prokaryotic membrane lipoprotein lipid attachment site profile [Nostoc flagelliforme CCNUN1]
MHQYRHVLNSLLYILITGCRVEGVTYRVGRHGHLKARGTPMLNASLIGIHNQLRLNSG